MPKQAHLCGVLLVLAAATAATSAGRGASWGRNGTIVFASSRAAALVHPAIYTVGLDGRSRRRISPILEGIDSPAWSPKGDAIAFLRSDHLYTLDSRTGRIHKVVPRGTSSIPVWSPDGSRIAFFRQREDESVDLFVVGAQGKGLLRVARRIRTMGPMGAGLPAWSPDGERIAFGRVSGRRQELRVVDLRTGAERRLAATRFIDADPAWSPDGSRIAFTRYYSWEDGVWALAVLDLRTRRVRQLRRQLEVPAWSPDGARIAAERGSTIYVLRADGRRLVRVGRDTIDENPIKPPLWSRDSRWIVAARKDAIYKLRADGRARRRIVRELPARRLEWTGDAGPILTISPDGRRIAYVSRPYDSGDFDLYRIDPAGGALRPLTKNRLADFDPALSPDGRTVAFTRGSRHPKIAILGKPSRLITDGAQASWSADGRRLAFVRGGDIYVIGRDGAGERLMTAGTGVEADPAWSPDGSKIAFASFLPGAPSGWDIWTVSSDGSGLRRLTDVRAGRDRCYPSDAREPAWSPSGAEIAYARDDYASLGCGLRGGRSTIQVMRSDGSGSREVTDGGWSDPLGDIGAHSPSWSPAGNEIAFVSELERGTRIAIVSASGGRARFLRKAFAAAAPDWR